MIEHNELANGYDATQWRYFPYRHGLSEYGPILGVIGLEDVEDCREPMWEPLTEKERHEIAIAFGEFDRYPWFDEIMEAVRPLEPESVARRSVQHSMEQFRYLPRDISSYGEILAVIRLEEVEEFLAANGYTPLTEEERYEFALEAAFFGGSPCVEEVLAAEAPWKEFTWWHRVKPAQAAVTLAIE